MGVLDKDSGQMDVYNAEIFNMQPLLSGRRVLCLTPVPGCGVLDLSVPSAITCLVPDDNALLSRWLLFRPHFCLLPSAQRKEDTLHFSL